MTPACAGTTTSEAGRRSGRSDDPRVRGDDGLEQDAMPYGAG